MEKFIAGLALGMIGGAVLVANSNKTRALVKKSQEDLKEKIDAYIDEILAGRKGRADKRKAKAAKKKNNTENPAPIFRAGFCFSDLLQIYYNFAENFIHSRAILKMRKGCVRVAGPFGKGGVGNGRTGSLRRSEKIRLYVSLTQIYFFLQCLPYPSGCGGYLFARFFSCGFYSYFTKNCGRNGQSVLYLLKTAGHQEKQNCYDRTYRRIRYRR
mgnify:CR=1 FL=1